MLFFIWEDNFKAKSYFTEFSEKCSLRDNGVYAWFSSEIISLTFFKKTIHNMEKDSLIFLKKTILVCGNKRKNWQNFSYFVNRINWQKCWNNFIYLTQLKYHFTSNLRSGFTWRRAKTMFNWIWVNNILESHSHF